MSSEHDEDRFIALETKAAYQEKAVSDLSEVIAQQAKVIADLERRLAGVERAFREAKVGEKDDLPHEPPPHY